jgi:uncharacterized protein YegJ (DUF2314 family)
MRKLSLLLLSLAGSVIPVPGEDAGVQGYKKTDEVMAMAYAEARSSVEEFIRQLRIPKEDHRYLVKMKVEANGHIEHMWTEPVRYEGGLFLGALANKPAKITSLKPGDVIKAKPAEISDWVILGDKGAVLAGGFTQKAMEKHRGVRPK